MSHPPIILAARYDFEGVGTPIFAVLPGNATPDDYRRLHVAITCGGDANAVTVTEYAQAPKSVIRPKGVL